ncbi:hypothetical protein NDU88_007130 [Pleurodeles waltl]|uniref:Uncharacterized protein n=1 Tax=Pleurodeles waltl TaxID=8319 RepID=A0AAV7SRP9_PLEWA|nr:hypothetical protein NDU88_007130 [Pleurodeles waltl]
MMSDSNILPFNDTNGPTRINRKQAEQEDRVCHMMPETTFQPFSVTSGTMFNKTYVNVPILLQLSLSSQLIGLLGLAGNRVVLW